jgi:hypothetical protein
MATKTAIITQEDIDLAVKEKTERPTQGISCCCVLFQVLKRCGYKPKLVGYITYVTEDHRTIMFPNPNQIRPITNARSRDWQQFLHTEVELPDPDNLIVL